MELGFDPAFEPVRASLVRFFEPVAARRSIMPSRWSMQPDQLRRQQQPRRALLSLTLRRYRYQSWNLAEIVQ
jgi:hypothetical protein